MKLLFFHLLFESRDWLKPILEFSFLKRKKVFFGFFGIRKWRKIGGRLLFLKRLILSLNDQYIRGPLQKLKPIACWLILFYIGIFHEILYESCLQRKFFIPWEISKGKSFKRRFSMKKRIKRKLFSMGSQRRRLINWNLNSWLTSQKRVNKFAQIN